MDTHDRPNGKWCRWLVAGIDQYGSRHVFNCAKEIVYVVTASGQLEHVERLYEQNASLKQWMAFVDDKRGWDRKQYGRSFGEMLDGAVEGSA